MKMENKKKNMYELLRILLHVTGCHMNSVKLVLFYNNFFSG